MPHNAVADDEKSTQLFLTKNLGIPHVFGPFFILFLLWSPTVLLGQKLLSSPRVFRDASGSIEISSSLYKLSSFVEGNCNNPSVFEELLIQSLKHIEKLHAKNGFFQFTWAHMNVKNMFSRWMTALYFHHGANRTWQIWYNLFCLILPFPFRDMNQFHILPILQDAAITVKGSLSPQQLWDIACAAGARSFLARHILK